MKNIEYFFTTLDPDDKQLNLFDLVLITINNVTDKGLSFEDIESRLKIKKSVEAAMDSDTKTLILEDADFNYLKSIVVFVKWAFVNDVLLKYKQALS